jgi:hypothetical protein
VHDFRGWSKLEGLGVKGRAIEVAALLHRRLVSFFAVKPVSFFARKLAIIPIRRLAPVLGFEDDQAELL